MMMEMNLVSVNAVNRYDYTFPLISVKVAAMPIQRELLRNKQYSYRPAPMTYTLIDGERVLLGPILYALMKERGVSFYSVIKATCADTKTTHEFLSGKTTARASKMGIGITSQIMRSANITVQDIVDKAREMRSLSTNESCISPTDVAPLAHDGRMDERNTNEQQQP
jgi:hypothetical protein